MARGGKSLGEAYVTVTGDLSPLKGSLAIARRMVSRFTSTISRSVAAAFKLPFKVAGAFFTQFVKWTKRASLAFAGFVTGAVYAWSRFEKQMAAVHTMLDAQTAHYLPAFSSAVRRMAVEFGDSTESLSKGLYDILSASVPAEKAIATLETASRAAVAGLTDTGTAADVLTTIMNAYSISADRATDVSDALFATVKRGKTTFPELAQNLGQVVSLAASAGVSLQELTATLALLTRAGVQTPHAVTQLNAVIANFLKPTEEAAEVAGELGIDLSATGLRAAGLVGVMKQLSKATSDQIAKMFPNIRALKGLSAALGKVTELQGDFNYMMNAGGRTAEAFGIMADTLSQKFASLRQRGVMVLVRAGETVIRVWDKVTPIIKTLVKTHFPSLVGAAGGVQEAFQHWMEDESGIKKVTNWLAKEFIGALEAGAHGMTTLVAYAREFLSLDWGDMWAVVSTAATQAWNDIVDTIKHYTLVATDFVLNTWDQHWPIIADRAEAAWQSITLNVGNMWDVVWRNMGEGFYGALRKMADKLLKLGSYLPTFKYMPVAEALRQFSAQAGTWEAEARNVRLEHDLSAAEARRDRREEAAGRISGRKRGARARQRERERERDRRARDRRPSLVRRSQDIYRDYVSRAQSRARRAWRPYEGATRAAQAKAYFDAQVARQRGDPVSGAIPDIGGGGAGPGAETPLGMADQRIMDRLLGRTLGLSGAQIAQDRARMAGGQSPLSASRYALEATDQYGPSGDAVYWLQKLHREFEKLVRQ